MRRLFSSEWRPILFGLVGTLFLFVLSRGPEVEAIDRIFQTVPSPTPRTIPTPPSPEPGGTPRPSGFEEGGVQTSGNLTLVQTLARNDVLPGDTLDLTIQVTNTLPTAILGIVLVAPLDPLLSAQEIIGTQAAVSLVGYAIHLNLGTLERGQSAKIVVRARVSADARPGQVLLHQFRAYYIGGEAISNLVPIGLPPDQLPETGRSGREP